ncbi:MAG: NADP-dependent phosphogluconate dehydrogenase, partial [Myxococcota bacterium]
AWDRALGRFLIEITAQIFTRKDDETDADLVDMVLDKTGMKGTGRWTVQEAAERSVPSPTITAALDSRYLSGLKAERLEAAKVFDGPEVVPANDRDAFVDDVRQALYASKICSYAQGMNLIRSAGNTFDWNLKLGDIARIWKGGCIIRAQFLGRIQEAYDRNANLPSLLMDPEFARELQNRQAAWRRVVARAVESGIAAPAMSGSLAYFDAYRRERLPANLVQAQRDFFGAHTYERTDREGTFHTDWDGSEG